MCIATDTSSNVKKTQDTPLNKQTGHVPHVNDMRLHAHTCKYIDVQIHTYFMVLLTEEN